MEYLNYHHLFYFWMIAKVGSVTKACNQLRLAQSTVSSQVIQLEQQIGHKLFDRKKKSLNLTETGKLVFKYAETIFSTGRELQDVLSNQKSQTGQILVRVGAIGSISKNLQVEFMRPALEHKNVRLKVIEGTQSALTKQLQNHELDVFISNTPVRSDRNHNVFSHKVGEVDVYAVGHHKYQSAKKNFPNSLKDTPVILPTPATRVRRDFENYIKEHGSPINIRAEIEDIALLRIFALLGYGVTIIPEIAVRPEIEEGKLFIINKLTSIYETVWAITASRKFPNPMVAEMVKRFRGRYTLATL